MSEEIETCTSILKSKESLGSAFEVYKAIDSVKKDLLKTFRDDLASELKLLGFHLMWDQNLENGKGSVGFGVKFSLAQNLYLRFEFENSGLNGLFWGIGREDKTILHDLALWGEIRSCMSNKFSMGGTSAWWPWYSTNIKEALDVDIKHWYKNERAWVLILDNGEDRLAKRVTRLACLVHDVFAGNYHLLTTQKT